MTGVLGNMDSSHKYEGSKAKIKKDEENYVAKCECGWSSDVFSSREVAIIEFEKHVKSDPKHKITEKKNRKNH